MGMTITITLDDDDPRTAQVLATLFGPPPAPAAPPQPAPLPPIAAPAPPAPIVVPANVQRLWDVLDPMSRREFVLLAERPWGPLELEQELGTNHRKLMGRHSFIGRYAARFGLGRVILADGRWRETRRFWLSPDVAPFVKVLAGVVPASVG